jgi:hypothetical protein
LAQGQVYHSAGRLGQATRTFEEVLANRRVKLGSDHPGTLKTTSALAKAYSESQQPDKAVPLAMQFVTMALPIRERLPQPFHKGIRDAASMLADHFARIGRTAEADRYRRLAVADGIR